MPTGTFNPEEMNELLIVAPVVALYSPIVLPTAFVTNRSPPDNAMPRGSFNPEDMKELLIVAPVVALYSPIVSLPRFVTNRSPPKNAMPIAVGVAEVHTILEDKARAIETLEGLLSRPSIVAAHILAFGTQLCRALREQKI
jgi:hypothetical protein